VPKKKIYAVPSIRRLPSYLHTIRQLQPEGGIFISGTQIAQELNLEPIQVRKDLAMTGITGKPKRGYPVDELIRAIERFLGWDRVQNAILLGAGNLGTALMGYGEFRSHRLNIIAAFDKDPCAQVHGVPVFPMDAIGQRISALSVKLAVLTVPSSSAQEVADILVRAGIEGIWNFTAVKLKVPGHVIVQNEDLSSGYAMLGVMLQMRHSEEPGS
jgi:redox-sensing transcriptional repressor